MMSEVTKKRLEEADKAWDKAITALNEADKACDEADTAWKEAKKAHKEDEAKR